MTQHVNEIPTRGFLSPQLAQRTQRHSLTLESGTEVAYWEYSPVVTDSSPESFVPKTILVIHGFRGDHHGLERVVDALPEYRFLMPDLPGFGESSAFTDRIHNIAGYVSFVEEFVSSLDLGPDTVLVGHSFGSIVASHFTAKNPQALRPLILINPIASPALEGPKGIMTRLAVGYYLAAARLPEAAGQAILRNKAIVRVMSVTMAKTRDAGLRRFIHGQHGAYFSAFANRTSLLESFKASVSTTVRQVAPQLKLPVLLIAGEKDEIATLDSQKVLLADLPNAELQVIPGVGHLIHYETPEAAANFIRRFLKEH
ncbi:alpha/beta fold hydrolase [Pseudarthrobacter sp. J1763]|uniref:alpha/beta fold hydrolase n=1 Tax=Pseudarthrobacter sp. J1763 TaxID=3420445 RepID=UPI003D29D4AC